jgi:hypothetical protein
MRRITLHQGYLRYAGLTIGPMAWAINTQLGQILPSLECSTRLPLLAGASTVLALLSMAAGYLSWHCDLGESDARPGHGAETASFIATLSALAGAFFAFPLLLQGMSSVVLTGCER